MCLAIPGKLIEISENNGLKMGRVDFSGTISSACLEYVPDIKIGQYAIVHAGFAISVLDEEEARKTLDLFDEIEEAVQQEEFNPFATPADHTPDNH